MKSTQAKVSSDFSRAKYSDAELPVRTNLIIGKVTNNPLFPEPVPTMAILQAANNAYYKALDRVKDGSKEDTVVKNNLREELESLLRQLALYVQMTSKGDEAAILSAGFEVHKRREAGGQLDKPVNVQVKPASNHGSMQISCNVVKRAVSYLFEYRELPANGENSWEQVISTRHKIQVDGLASGKQYAFRVAGISPDPSRNWSDEISSFVL